MTVGIDQLRPFDLVADPILIGSHVGGAVRVDRRQPGRVTVWPSGVRRLVTPLSGTLVTLVPALHR